jgi:hypothetical protein
MAARFYLREYCNKCKHQHFAIILKETQLF